jgi:hypothetical protein
MSQSPSTDEYEAYQWPKELLLGGAEFKYDSLISDSKFPPLFFSTKLKCDGTLFSQILHALPTVIMVGGVMALYT